MSLAAKHDILLCQEAHGVSEDAQELEVLHPDFLVFFSPAESSNSGGILTIVRKSFAAKFTTITWRPLVPGRIGVLMCDSGEGSLFITNVHMVPAWPLALKQQHFRRTLACHPQDSAIMNVIAGDFNAISPGEFRFHTSTGRLKATNDQFGQWMEDQMDRFAEVFQDDYTRISTRYTDDGPLLDSLSRLDRAYIDLPPLELSDRRPVAKVLGSVADWMPFSDHLPVSFCLHGAPRSAPARPSVPQWVAQHPRFHAVVSEFLDDMPDDLIPLEALKLLKRILQVAATRVKKELLDERADSPAQHFYLAAKAHRMARSGLVAGTLPLFRASSRLAELLEGLGSCAAVVAFFVAFFAPRTNGFFQTNGILAI